MLSGVRVHNLKDVRVRFPRHALIAVTGPSGSGKSSLAMDALYAEGRRRYVESLTTYARQFLERLPRPELEAASGLSPAVAFERKAPPPQARSTVGTVTEIADYLRIFFALAGDLHCPRCGERLETHTPTEAAAILAGAPEERLCVLAPLELPVEPDGLAGLRRKMESSGYRRVWSGDREWPLDEVPWPPREDLALVVDRVRVRRGIRRRLAEAVENAYRLAAGRAAARGSGGRTWRFTRRPWCPVCRLEARRPTPGELSPNSPLGACPTCRGFGRIIGVDWNKVIPDPGLSLRQGAVEPWNKPAYREAYRDLRRAGRRVGLDWDRPYRDLPEEQRRLVEKGGDGFYGIEGFFRWLEARKYKTHVRVFLARYRAYTPCPACGGKGLRAQALAVRIRGLDVADFQRLAVDEGLGWLAGWRPEGTRGAAAAVAALELERRLRFLADIGLGYLSLSRPARTLSGGEYQRVLLSASLAGGLVDTLHVLDEPTVGLHPLDADRLVAALERIRDRGNTVVLVEHDPRTIRACDYVVDLGPGAGAEGGRVVFQGSRERFLLSRRSLTAAYVSGRRRVARPRRRPRPAPEFDRWIELEGVRTHNLQNVTLRIPRGGWTVVAGVSGSGKSSLVHDTLYGALVRALTNKRAEAGPYTSLRGAGGLAGVERVDGTPVGRTPRSIPATYVGALAPIRSRLAATAEARRRGYGPGRFSFNIAGGRCEDCQGAGVQHVEMQFLPDLNLVCETCRGTRFKAETLEVRYRGANIHDVLNMTVDQALEHFASAPEIVRRLRPLHEVGLGYLRLGQPAPTLSSGESQRLKLASRLDARSEGSWLLILDEPTTGLHPRDLEPLLAVLGRLRDAGHTLVVVEHHLDVLAAADWVVELGPGAGSAGGRIIAEGPPEAVAQAPTPTGRYLARHLSTERVPEG